jgi:hypothetical protein
MSFFLFFAGPEVSSTGEREPDVPKQSLTTEELAAEKSNAEKIAKELEKLTKAREAEAREAETKENAQDHCSRINEFLIENLDNLPESVLEHQEIAIDQVLLLEKKFSAALQRNKSPEEQEHFSIHKLVESGKIPFPKFQIFIEKSIQKELKKQKTLQAENEAQKETEEAQKETETTNKIKEYTRLFKEVLVNNKGDLKTSLQEMLKYKKLINDPALMEQVEYTKKQIKLLSDERIKPTIRERFQSRVMASSEPFSQKTFEDTFTATILYPADGEESLPEADKKALAEAYGVTYNPRTATDMKNGLQAMQKQKEAEANAPPDTPPQEKPPPMTIGGEGTVALDKKDPGKMEVTIGGESFTLDVPDKSTDATAEEFREKLDTIVVYNALRKMGLEKSLYPGLTRLEGAKEFRPQDLQRSHEILTAVLGQTREPGDLLKPDEVAHLEKSLHMFRNPDYEGKNAPEYGKHDLLALNILQPDGSLNQGNFLLGLTHAGDFPEEAKTTGFEDLKEILWAGEEARQQEVEGTLEPPKKAKNQPFWKSLFSKKSTA